ASSFGCYSFFFCFLIIRRPPTPTLFPYTTLFRSYNSQKYYYKSTIIGGSIIGLYNPVNEIQISAEFEENNVSIDWDNRTGFANENYWYPSLFLGVGYHARNLTIGIRFDVLYDNSKSTYADPWMPFVRVYF